jgi:hypothetical protein
MRITTRIGLSSCTNNMSWQMNCKQTKAIR